MSAVSASAPGKLVLAGEYAVLDGAPAIAMAVNRRARVRVSARGGASHVVRAPGYSDTGGRFRVQNGAVSWKSGAERYGIVEAVWRAAGVETAEALSLVLDSRGFDEGGRKLGLGSSAATCVALTAALLGFAGSDADPAEPAMRAHRAFQRGKGSGVDVAAALSGGLIEYSIGAGRAARLDWPAGLEYAVLSSGVPSDTRAMLGRFEERRERSPGRELAAAAAAMAEGFRRGTAADVMARYPGYVEALERFDRDTGIGIFGGGHARLVALARRAGVVYKPCGAGGGDVGMAFGTERAALDAFVEAAAGSGFGALTVRLEPRGVEVRRRLS